MGYAAVLSGLEHLRTDHRTTVRVPVRVKNEELAALKEINDQEYADEPAFLKAMFEGVVELLSKRDAWGVGVRYTASSGVTPYGPWYNKAQASKAGKLVGGALSTEHSKVDVFLQQLNAPSKILVEENIDNGK